MLLIFLSCLVAFAIDETSEVGQRKWNPGLVWLIFKTVVKDNFFFLLYAKAVFWVDIVKSVWLVVNDVWKRKIPAQSPDKQILW